MVIFQLQFELEEIQIILKTYQDKSILGKIYTHLQKRWILVAYRFRYTRLDTLEDIWVHHVPICIQVEIYMQ